MTDQIKSPAGGQGFDDSLGGECRAAYYQNLAESARAVKPKWAGPVFVTPCPPAENGGTLRAVTTPVTSKLSPLWKAGEIFHPYLLLQEARHAAANGRVLLIAVEADGKEVSFALKDMEAWLRGEEGR